MTRSPDDPILSPASFPRLFPIALFVNRVYKGRSERRQLLLSSVPGACSLNFLGVFTKINASEKKNLCVLKYLVLTLTL